MLFGHGSDIHQYKDTIIADFSSNVWYKGLHKELTNYLESKLQNIVHYPEPDAGELSKKIAKLHGVSNKNVLVTNGATEAFYLLAQLYSRFYSNILYPAFAEYEDACKSFNHTLHYVNNTEFDLNTYIKTPSLFWLGNPNNPDGKITSRKDIENLCANNPNVIFIIDEAYAELCDKFESVINLVDKYNNLIVVRSLTKAFSIPGIRLGYMVGSTKIIDKIKSIKIPWSVNTLAIEAGNFIISDYHSLLPNKKILAYECKALQNEFLNIPELEIIPSDCNYFLVRLTKGKASDLKQFLIKKYGLLIRDASNFRGLNESYFRIAIQKPEFNTQLVNAIKQWIKNNS